MNYRTTSGSNKLSDLNNYERCDLRQDDESFYSLAKFLLKNINDELSLSTSSSTKTPLVTNETNSHNTTQKLSAVEKSLSIMSTNIRLKFLDAVNYRISLMPTFPDPCEDDIMKLARDIKKLCVDLNIDMNIGCANRDNNATNLPVTFNPNSNAPYVNMHDVNIHDINQQQFYNHHHGCNTHSHNNHPLPSPPPQPSPSPSPSPSPQINNVNITNISSQRKHQRKQQSRSSSPQKKIKSPKKQPMKEVEIVTTDEEVEFVEEPIVTARKRNKSPEKKQRRNSSAKKKVGTAVFVADDEEGDDAVYIASIPKHKSNKKHPSSPNKRRYNLSKSPKRHDNHNNVTDYDSASSDSDSSSGSYNQIKKSLKSKSSSKEAQKLYKSIYNIRHQYKKATNDLNDIEIKSKIRQQLLDEMKVVMNMLNTTTTTNNVDYEVRNVCQRHLIELQNNLKKYSYDNTTTNNNKNNEERQQQQTQRGNSSPIGIVNVPYQQQPPPPPQEEYYNNSHHNINRNNTFNTSLSSHPQQQTHHNHQYYQQRQQNNNQQYHHNHQQRHHTNHRPTPIITNIDNPDIILNHSPYEHNNNHSPHSPLTHDYLEETQFSKALNNASNKSKTNTTSIMTQTIPRVAIATQTTTSPTFKSICRDNKSNKVVIQVGSNIISVRSTDDNTNEDHNHLSDIESEHGIVSKKSKKSNKKKLQMDIESDDSSCSNSEEEEIAPKLTKKKKRVTPKQARSPASRTSTTTSLSESINAEIIHKKRYHSRKNTKKIKNNYKAKDNNKEMMNISKFTSDDSCCDTSSYHDSISCFSNGSVTNNNYIVRNIKDIEMASVKSSKSVIDNKNNNQNVVFSDKLDTLIEKIDTLQQNQQSNNNDKKINSTNNSVYSSTSTKGSRGSKSSRRSKKKSTTVKAKSNTIIVEDVNSVSVSVNDSSTIASQKDDDKSKANISLPSVVISTNNHEENPQEKTPSSVHNNTSSLSNVKSELSSITNLHSNIKTNKQDEVSLTKHYIKEEEEEPDSVLSMQDKYNANNSVISYNDNYSGAQLSPIKTPESIRLHINALELVSSTPPITNESIRKNRGYHTTSSMHKEKYKRNENAVYPPPPPHHDHDNDDINFMNGDHLPSYYHLPSYGNNKSMQSSHPLQPQDNQNNNDSKNEYFLFEDNDKPKQQQAKQSQLPKVVKVEAPETLPEFFSFEAKLGNETFWVTVPAGGVEKGQIFTSPMHNTTLPSYSANNDNTPDSNKEDTMMDHQHQQKDYITKSLTDNIDKSNISNKNVKISTTTTTTLAQNKQPLLSLKTDTTTMNNSEMVHGSSTAKDNKDNQIIMNIPKGKWRNGLCDCLLDGVDHPMLLNSLCCPQIALAQIMARMYIDPFGKQITHQSRAHNKIKLNNIIALSVLVLSANVIVTYFIARVYILHDGYIMNQQSVIEILTLLIPILLLDVGCIIYFYMLLISTRKIIRNSFDIPQEQCATCSDIFPSLCFTCCTISQMGRHTAEYRTYRSMCCTDTGLPIHVDTISLQDAGGSSNNNNNGVVTGKNGIAVDNASNGGTIDTAISV